jgi:prolipoprotein diacylglyceryl transferase
MSPLAYIPPPPTNGVHVGPLFFHLYGLCIAIGILAAVSLARRRWRQMGHDPAELERAAFWGVVAGFVGGRLAYVSTHTGDFAGRWPHVVAVWEGGLALYGGLTLGVAVGALVAWRQGLPVGATLDAAVPGIPLAQAFGRWGNYFNQELFGTPTRVPWALEVEPRYRPARYAGFETFHPTFLYESLFNLLVCGLLIWIGNTRRLRTGSLLLCYGVLYATGRFFLELLRTDTTYRLAGLSRNAYVSIAVVLAGSAALVWRERRGRGADEEQDEQASASALAAVAAVTGAPPPDAPSSGAGSATRDGGDEAADGDEAPARDQPAGAAGNGAADAGAAEGGAVAANDRAADAEAAADAAGTSAAGGEADGKDRAAGGEAADGEAAEDYDATGGTLRRRWQTLRRRWQTLRRR